MNCPSCQTPNPDSAKFCMACGAALAVVCGNCGAQLPTGASFCSSCGQPVQEVDEPRTTEPQLQQYIPPELLSRLEAARARGGMAGERRVVTMLFCDVQGSTAAAEQLDPEDWHEIMNGAFEHLIAPVYRYEGTLARLMGDAVLAFFGAPITHEDDPQRAVLAALDIITDIAPYRQEVSSRWGLDFNVRVGINTGLVVVGEVGSDLRLEYTAMGDAINLAARMEQTAEPGTVQISADTYRLVAPLFEVSELKRVAVKGKAEPVEAYRVLGQKAIPGRLRGIEGLRSPLIGRDKESEGFKAALDALSRGTGGIVCLIGEAGLGKSRLISEARDAFQAGSKGGRWHETASLSYETGQPYGLIRRLLAGVSGVGQNDAPSEVRDKTSALVAPLDEGRRQQGESVLAALFGTGSGSDMPVEGETFKGLLFTTMLALWEQLTADTPTVLVFDDLHWADAASVDLVTHLMQLVDRASLLVVGAMRPEQIAPGWRIKQAAEKGFPHRYSEVHLRPLSESDSDALVDGLLAVADFPRRLRERILTRAEGNPFFVEEVVRTLIDSQAIVHDVDRGRWVVAESVGETDIDLPDNLQSLLVARIDRLDEGARHTLQVAGVIGRSFHRRVLEGLTGPGDDLDAQLVALQRAELVSQTAPAPEPEYAFRHALTQQAAYSTILLRQRRLLHRQVGETLETLFPGRRNELAPTLAHHFAEARDSDRALEYFTLAGDVAFRMYASSEAAAHYGRALETALSLKTGSAQLMHLYVARGRALELDNQYDEAVENYDGMEALAQERGDRELELAALAARATVFATQSPKFDPARAKVDSEGALTLARQLGDGATESRILWNLLLVNLQGLQDAQTAVAYGEESLAIARRLDLSEQIAFTQSDLGWAYAGVGELAKAEATLEQARSLWRELGNLPMLANNLSVSWMLAYLRGDYQFPMQAAAEAYEISLSIGNLWGQWSATLPGAFTYLELGRAGEAIEAALQADSLTDEAGLVVQKPFGLALLAWIYAGMGDIEAGKVYYRKVDASTLDRAPAFMQAWLLGVLALFDIAAGDLPNAEAKVEALPELDLSNFAYPSPIFVMLATAQLAMAQGKHHGALRESEEMIAVLKKAGVRTFLPDALHIKGQALSALDRPDDAYRSLEEARSEAEAIGSRRSLWPVLHSLSQLEAERGSHAEAESLRHEARQVVEYVADHAGSNQLRDSLLSLPDVRDIVAGLDYR